MNFQELFSNIKERFSDTDVSDITERLAIQVNLTGEGAGTFYIEIKEGKLAIEPYDYRDRDVALTLSSADFIKVLDKKLDPVAAFTLGRLKADGDIGKALILKKLIH